MFCYCPPGRDMLQYVKVNIMRMRKKRNLPQRIERCGSLFVPDPEAYRGVWLERVPGYQYLHLEIGCGRGRFTVETAKTLPDTLLVAVERVPDAMITGMERAFREEVQNLRFISADAANLDKLFAPGEVDVIYLNFCDPWPGKRHAKRRLTYGTFLKQYAALLRPGGEIRFKTDNDELFAFSLESFAQCGFEVDEVTYNLHENGPGIMTDYEQKFHSQGVLIKRCVARIKKENETATE